MQEILSYVIEPFLLQGALTAIEIAALAMIIGLTLGLCIAMMRLSNIKILAVIAWFYTWFMRGTPLLLQLVFIYDALPLVGIKLDNFTTAVVGFALNEAGFSGEFIRGGILSVNRTQIIAASALGFGPFLSLRRIILPQAIRAILPQIANSAISMIKGTSIASVMGRRPQSISRITYELGKLRASSSLERPRGMLTDPVALRSQPSAESAK